MICSRASAITNSTSARTSGSSGSSASFSASAAAGFSVAGAKRGLDPAANLAQHDPFLADFMIGQEAARQEGMPAVVEGQVGQGRAAAARDEEDQPGPVALFGGIVRRP